MTSPDLSQSLPDPHWVMPHTAGHVLLGVFGGGAAVFVLCCALLSYRRRSALPLLFALGGLCAILLEPIADTLGNVQHRPVGQINAFVVDGQPIPWAVVLGYIWYFGLGPVLLTPWAERRAMTPRRWYTAAGLAMLAVTLVEQIPIHYNLWEYYGNQPLVLGLMPSDMAIANMVSVVVPMMVVYAVWPILTGWRQLLVVPLAPICVVGSHTAAAAPAYMLINANPSTSMVWVDLAGLVTIAFSILIVWFSAQLLHGGFPELRADRERRAGSDEPVPATAGGRERELAAAG